MGIVLLGLILSVGTGCARRTAGDPPVPRHELTRYHKAFALGKPWRLTSRGVELKGAGIERTAGSPKTATWIWETWHDSIDRWSAHYGVPAELVIAVIATESAPARGAPGHTRDPASVRRERQFVSVSSTPQYITVGLMQTSVYIARAALADSGIDKSRIDDRWLKDPDNAIRAGTALIAWQARGKFSNVATLFDPPVVLAAYNAGGLYRMGGHSNRWKMRQYPAKTGRHVDRGIRYFNDAVEVLRTHSIRPKYGYRDFVYHPPEWPQAAASPPMSASVLAWVGEP
jgi:hypothetical protein